MCTYQNLELTHVRVGVAKVGSQTLHVGLRPELGGKEGGTCKIKDFDTQVSIFVRRVSENT